MKPRICSVYTNALARPQWVSPVLPRPFQHRRRSFASAHQYKALEVLDNADIDRFREEYFIPERPVILPRQYFHELPAYERWFHRGATPNIPRLNTEYLEPYGGDAIVPLELTQPESQPSGSSSETFRKFHAPLSLFLQWIREAESSSQIQSRLYLAQCQLLDLPQALRDDFPTPTIVAKAGKGDVYDTNVWIGHPPTYTPLHRDPNPNLFVQLAGRKTVRLLAPQNGQTVFSYVRGQLGQSGSREAAAFRGEEMMQGRERALLEQAVWDDAVRNDTQTKEGFEAQMEAGDGLFIPKGWWHSIKGTGESVTASVNWWFR
ncbi:Clavaminate synthase-like protein [Aspergillus unguis]